MGHPSVQNQKVPLGIEALAQEHVVHIACGGSTSAAVTGKNSVFHFFLTLSAFLHLFMFHDVLYKLEVLISIKASCLWRSGGMCYAVS